MSQNHVEETNAEKVPSPSIEHHSTSSKSRSKLPLYIGGGVILIVVLIAGILGVQHFSKNEKLMETKKSVKKIAVSKSPDQFRARHTDVNPLKETTIQVYADNRMVVRLDIPKGAISKATTITLIPYKDENNNLQVQISPANTKFVKPVTLTFDLSRTKLRTDAPIAVTQTARTTGKTQLVQVDHKNPILQLIARSTETRSSVTGRILSGGTYQLALTPTNQQQIARDALSDKKATSLTVLEAGSELFYNKQQLSKDERSKILQSAEKVISFKDPSPYELFPAVLLQKDLKTHASIFIQQVYAADISAGFYEFRCKDRTLSVDEYVVAAQTAQMLGHDDIGEKCMDAAKNRIAEEARNVLAQANPPTSEIVRMMAKVQMFGLAELDVALQEKLEKDVKKKVEDVLKDPNATLTDVIKALQESQLTGDNSHDAELNQRIQDLGTKEVDRVLNDPQSNMVEVAIAVQKAQALGLESKANQGIDKLQQMSKRTAQEVLDNPRSSAKELQDALGQAGLEGKDQAYKNQIRDRIKKAQIDEAKPTPAPSPKNGDSEENLEVGVDWSIIGLAFAQLIGIESFDEQSLKKFTQEQTDKGNELLDMAPEICAELREYISDFPDLMKNCDWLEGPARGELQDAHDKAFGEAEHVGDIQSDDYEDADYEMHMEIEFTPTPESNDGYSDEGNGNAEYTDDTSDNTNTSESEVQQEEQSEVQGAKTYRKTTR